VGHHDGVELRPGLSLDDAFLAAFASAHGIRRLALYGSALRDDFGSGSDIDLLVEFRPEHYPDKLNLSVTTVFPNAVLYENTIVGQHVIIHANAVLGGYGFGYSTVDGRHKLGSQLGHVEVGDHVEIGASTAIDRGTYGATVIGNGTKIDNLVQIGHNCRIGRHNLICSQVGIAGSCSTGEYVVMAGQVGLADHLHIGDGALLGAKAGVMTDALPGKRYLGAPAVEERQFFRSISLIQQLPEIRRQLHEVQRAVIRLAGDGGGETDERKDAA